ncbi:MAG: hypothetical protein KME50_12975 [Nostoc desertorum CM1-VF14]|nr:hypothetical protein [Nostoc desertorum CM1-VF14]
MLPSCDRTSSDRALLYLKTFRQAFDKQYLERIAWTRLITLSLLHWIYCDRFQRAVTPSQYLSSDRIFHARLNLHQLMWEVSPCKWLAAIIAL